ncbi:hypothetical protein PMI15_03321 [Polaromonas sp. CF318]|uniref:hypothetical protein n=1 Tax=Polaromonas sp. CF318 TaxID=1144318 RepID=UPI0002711F59|nr:hypothetical protein [Polaromonas sp. CF318]EJL81991.1 hypothetical protein PMI15_03321 [Polaromonas sp. CF318]
MRSSLIAIAVAISACTTASATSSISFEADGYLLDVTVGDDSRPSIAALSFGMPGGKQSVVIPMRHIKVEAFDTQQKVLLLRFINPGDSTLPKDFILSVRNDAGVLTIDGKSSSGRFSWGV